MKYLLIDGSNLAIRAAFANETLTTMEGVPSGCHYGFFNSLVTLKRKFPDYQYLITWDSKSKRRVIEAQAGVTSGIIQSGYKENRKKDDQPKPLLDFFAQAPFLKKGIEQTGIPQIKIHDYEADDVVASYCKKLSSDGHEIVVVTSDKDYYQLLSKDVTMWDGMKMEETTMDSFIKDRGIDPIRWVDIGALMGDDGDNIHGVVAWGEKTATEAIKTHGSWEKVLASFHQEYDPLRVKFPDLINNEAEFKRLCAIATKSGKAKYPEIIISMPFTGVTLAVEDKKTPAIPKTTLMALMMEDRVKLAYSLKKMDCDIPDLPEIVNGQSNQDKLLEYFNYYDIASLVMDIPLLCS